MWIAAHGSNTGALPDIPRHRAVAGLGMLRDMRGDGGTCARRPLISGVPPKSEKYLVFEQGVKATRRVRLGHEHYVGFG